MSEKLSSGTINLKQTNKTNKIIQSVQLLSNLEWVAQVKEDNEKTDLVIADDPRVHCIAR